MRNAQNKNIVKNAQNKSTTKSTHNKSARAWQEVTKQKHNEEMHNKNTTRRAQTKAWQGVPKTRAHRGATKQEYGEECP